MLPRSTVHKLNANSSSLGGEVGLQSEAQGRFLLYSRHDYAV